MNNPKKLNQFINLAQAIPALEGNGLRKTIRTLLEKILGITEIRQTITDASLAKTHNIFARTLEILNILIDAKNIPQTIQKIPPGTGAIIIANHPFGGADAIALSALCAKYRPDDSKILANSIVYHAPKFKKYLLPLKILGEPNAKLHNLKTLKQATEHIKNGGLLAVFPAGGVSHYQSDQQKTTDAPWSHHIARIAIHTKAPVIPIKFFGKNPLWFQLIGKIHPLLRAALIPRALLIMKHKTIKCRAGNIIQHQTLTKANNPTQTLRDAVYSIST